MKKSIALICCILTLALPSCSNYARIEDEAFQGDWELKGRSMYQGMKIRIVKEDQGLKGYILTTPTSKYGRLFLDSGKVWMSDIDRSSNFAFKFKEQKIASELFSLYGLETTSTFYVTFSEDRKRINLFQSSQDRLKDSDVYYQRVN